MIERDGRQIPTFFGTTGFQLGQTFIPWYRFITIVTGLVIAVLLRILLYRSRLGVSMRAVVDNRDLAALNGARPGRTSQFAWALGTSMSAIAGIFLAEELSNLSVETLTFRDLQERRADIRRKMQQSRRSGWRRVRANG